MIDRKQSKHLDDVSAGDQPAETNGDVAALLAEIVAEVENRGPTGHWMNPSSPLIARATGPPECKTSWRKQPTGNGIGLARSRLAGRARQKRPVIADESARAAHTY